MFYLFKGSVAIPATGPVWENAGRVYFSIKERPPAVEDCGLKVLTAFPAKVGLPLLVPKAFRAAFCKLLGIRKFFDPLLGALMYLCGACLLASIGNFH